MSTARRPKANDAAFVTRTGDELAFGVGNRTLARVNLRARGSAGDQCNYELRISDMRWSLEGGPERLAEGGRLATMPTVFGVFSGLDIRSATPPSIDVTTHVHDTRATVRQKLGWTVGALLALAALWLVAVPRRPRRVTASAVRLLRRAARDAGAADLVVAVVLLGWWVIAPAFYDDGWVIARQSMFSTSGGFSNYYDSVGANLPLGYWLEWVNHWLVDGTKAVLFLRIPALLCLAATWVLCRWGVARVSALAREGVVRWTLASAFAVGALSWGMTLRFEPPIALFVTGVFVCTIRFLDRGSPAPLAVAGILVTLAVSAHPAGLVSVAPLLAATPRLFRWSRSRPSETVTLLAAGTALLAVLAFVGSDLDQRRADSDLTRTYGNAPLGWRDELVRYTLLTGSYFGTSVERASVAMMLLVVAAFLFRTRRKGQFLLNIPARSVGIGLVLLMATPSKWPWHFGALLGLVALASASEIARLQVGAARTHGVSIRPLLALVGVLGAAQWAWSSHVPWDDLDLVTLDWTVGSSRARLILGVTAPLLFLLLVLAMRARRSGERLREPSKQLVRWSAPVFAVPLIAFTAAVPIADSARAHSWTLRDQNLATLEGGLGCGLADDVVVAKQSSMTPLAPVEAPARPAIPPWVPLAPVDGLTPFALHDRIAGSAETPWFALPADRRIGIFVANTDTLFSHVVLEWGRRRTGRVEPLGRKAVWDDSAAVMRSQLVAWRFLAATELPSAPRSANVVRVTVEGSPFVDARASIAVTAPVTYENQPLATRVERTGARTLVTPGLVTYVPCAEQPHLGGGIVEVPGEIVALHRSLDPVFDRGVSPFDGVGDLYRLERMSLADSKSAPRTAVVYEVDRRIRGSLIAPPDKTPRTT